MKSKLAWLVTVLFSAVMLAVMATSANSIMNAFPRTNDGYRQHDVGVDRSFGSHGGRYLDMDRSFRGGSQFRDLGREDRTFSGKSFGGNRFFFGFGVPLYSQPYYDYTPYYYGRYYTPSYYYDYGYTPSSLVYLNDYIGALWLDSTSLKVSWLGPDSSLERLDYILSDGFRRELMHTSAYNPPYCASLVVPYGAAYVTVRAIAHGGLVVSEVTSPLP